MITSIRVGHVHYTAGAGQPQATAFASINAAKRHSRAIGGARSVRVLPSTDDLAKHLALA